MQLRLFGILEQRFSEGAGIYSQIVDQLKDRGDIPMDYPKELVIIQEVVNLEGNRMNVATSILPSVAGLYLVDFLEQRVPDFNRLVEEARINGKTRKLAREIEDRFGKGSYRKIVTANTKEETEELIEELKNVDEYTS